MILSSVLMGYILGVLPFVIPRLIERIDNKKEKTQEKEINKSQEEILDEWLNGAKKTEGINQFEKINQQDIYNEYITGEIQKGE